MMTVEQFEAMSPKEKVDFIIESLDNPELDASTLKVLKPSEDFKYIMNSILDIQNKKSSTDSQEHLATNEEVLEVYQNWLTEKV